MTADAPNTPDLQFDRVEGPRPDGARCTACARAISDTYYEVNGQVMCEHCRRAVEDQFKSGTSAGHVVRAFSYGVATAGLGFGVYWGIARLTGMEFSLIAILVGIMVGGAIKRASNGRGGRRYQLMAVFLTYTAIVCSYVPFAWEELRNRPVAVLSADSAAARTSNQAADSASGTIADRLTGPRIVVALGVLLILAYAMPFLAGLENILGLVIIAIGLYAAWKTAAISPLHVRGPFHVGQTSPA